MIADDSFDITEYFPTLVNVVKAYGWNITITEKEKTKETNIQSAFLKGNTKEHLLQFYTDSNISKEAGNETITIKLEVDINPPRFAASERKYRLLPAPYEVNLNNVRSLFTGKIHAVICRA